jgi:DNA polymerase-3 subunit delta
MELSVEKLREQIRAGNFAPVYLLYGEESYLRNLAAQTIAQRAFSKDDLQDLNFAEYNLTETNLGSVLLAAEQAPMFSTRRVIFVNSVKIGASSSGDTIAESDLELLDSYLSNPPETTILIFICDELNANRKASKLLLAKATCIRFDAPDQKEIHRRIESRFNELSVTAEKAAIEVLINRTAQDLRRAMNETEKLALYLGVNNKLSVDVVESLVSDVSEVSNFELSRHLIEGNRAKAVAVTKKLLADGVEPILLIGSLFYSFRRLALVAEMLAEGFNPESAIKAAGLRYFEKDTYFRAAKKIGTTKLRFILRRLAEADIAIKSSGFGQSGSRLEFEMAIIEISAACASQTP